MAAVVFRPGEREVVDECDLALRDALALFGHPVSGVGSPYVEHHRWARVEIVRGKRKPRPVFSEIAGLLLDWSRHSGDVRLYVYQPFVFWAGEQGVKGPAMLVQARELVSAAPVPFLEYARAMVLDGNVSA